MTRISHLSLAAATACAALLTACGGGLGKDDEIAPASPQAMQSFNELAPYCGTSTTLPTSDSSETLDQAPTWVTLHGLSYNVNTLYAANGWAPIDDEPAVMDLPMSDMRGLSATSGVSFGFASPAVKMGVSFVPGMPAAAITCTRGLNAFSKPSWLSRDAGVLDLRGLPAPAVDGFEWVANFEPSPGKAYFTAPRTKVDPATARVCRRAPGVSTWSCSVPSVADAGSNWTLSVSPVSRGIYVLVANAPTAP